MAGTYKIILSFLCAVKNEKPVTLQSLFGFLSSNVEKSSYEVVLTTLFLSCPLLFDLLHHLLYGNFKEFASTIAPLLWEILTFQLRSVDGKVPAADLSWQHTAMITSAKLFTYIYSSPASN